jgi:hypothetical protein
LYLSVGLVFTEGSLTNALTTFFNPIIINIIINIIYIYYY